jgi:hypothetical protein
VQWRTSVLLGSALVIAATAGGGVGWLAGRAAMSAEVVVAERGLRMSLGGAEAWLPILQANPDPRPAVARGQVFRDERTRLRAGTITLYLEPGDGGMQQTRR